MSITPEDMEACLRVLQRVSEDPDLIGDHDRMKGLVAKIHREGKKGARGAAREQGRAADRQLKAGAALVRAQQGDEGLPALTDGAALGTLHRPAHCYVCKAAYKEVHPLYHLLCPECADLNARKRCQTVDLTGRTALITGGRIKIGYQTALRLLRDGARVIVTTRFPADAANRFGAEADAGLWRDRLRIEGLDLRGNGITREGQEVLADALTGNTQLCRLMLDGKPHPRLAALMRRNQGLQVGGEPPVARDVMLTRSVYR